MHPETELTEQSETEAREDLHELPVVGSLQSAGDGAAADCLLPTDAELDLPESRSLQPPAGPWRLLDHAAPLSAGLRAAVRLRFPEAPEPPAEPVARDQSEPPAGWLAALAPALAECLVGYAGACGAAGDLAELRGLAPHLAALCYALAVIADRQLLPALHAAYACRVALLLRLGRYADANAAAAQLGALASAGRAELGRADWLAQGLAALEIGQYAAADAALATAAAFPAPVGKPDWQLLLGRADLAAATGNDQRALDLYAELDQSGAPGWLRMRSLVARARIWLACGRTAQAAPLVEQAGALEQVGELGGLARLAAAELALAGGMPSQALTHAIAAHTSLAERLGEQHALVAGAALIEAQCSYAAGAYPSADAIVAWALPHLLDAHGSAHPQIVQALTLQGLLAGVAGDTTALGHDMAAAARAARKLAGAAPQAAVAADLIECTAALAQGRAERARAAAVRALAGARDALDATHPQIAACLDALAECERALGRWSVARVYGDMALALRESVFGADHPLTATSWELLGHVGMAARAFRPAREAFELAVQIRRAALGLAHPLTAAAQLALARACVALGELERAESAAVAALGGFEQAYGPLHPQSRAARALLAQFSSPLRRRWWIARARLRRAGAAT